MVSSPRLPGGEDDAGESGIYGLGDRDFEKRRDPTHGSTSPRASKTASFWGQHATFKEDPTSKPSWTFPLSSKGEVMTGPIARNQASVVVRPGQFQLDFATTEGAKWQGDRKQGYLVDRLEPGEVCNEGSNCKSSQLGILLTETDLAEEQAKVAVGKMVRRKTGLKRKPGWELTAVACQWDEAAHDFSTAIYKLQSGRLTPDHPTMLEL